ncbi:MAG: arsenite methyltransferase [Actinomycetia bacterium]|nr:arsenite methyltransferase [Actinomycetes bacterium]
MENKDIKKIVRENYGKMATQGSSCCGPQTSCGPTTSCGGTGVATDVSKSIGYTDEDIGVVPEGANLGLGCGNPIALASLKEGETVLDLGSGAGFDCFLAAIKVGKSGKVIGVDMTPEMIEKARENAIKDNYKNVEFRLGEIDNLPVADNSVDIAISNCVINLAPDKSKVFKEAYRVLKPGGRMMISDIVLVKELPEQIMNSIEAYVGCVSGAIKVDDYLEIIEDTGFSEVKIIEKSTFPVDSYVDSEPIKDVIQEIELTDEEIKEVMVDTENAIASIKVYAEK